ncbi:hypothetical protein CI102_10442 [Trichoderma harzianum]|uniref:Uncharacterized protein n=1 Tax=Trichoderma harzianum CBS 226.95 TaxID=983964 RepID=A0A2T4A1D5_TRIHA|nr:hypothetical protein M431DRAFT_246379 [Trichoderma harzianum CBS 226.95]PKK44333.1 hypothetical protein CI102_10442 [Trichoderma harzianum]PTB50838.1 hypothetical protein M431DRAFT_246379 [Trichoderma harzianum CBS 226.95]
MKCSSARLDPVLLRLFSLFSPSLFCFIRLSHSFHFRFPLGSIYDPPSLVVFLPCNTTLNLDLTSHGPSVRPPPSSLTCAQSNPLHTYEPRPEF